MHWLFCVCSIRYYTLYFVCLQPSFFTFFILIQLAFLKYFPLFAHHNIVPASSCLLEWIFSVSFIPQFCFMSLNSSMLPFLCSVFFFSFLEHGRLFFVSLPSTPQQLFSLSLTLFFHLLSICLFLILHQPDMVGQATPLDETQENMSSPAINAK